jgi:hypothetical protein
VHPEAQSARVQPRADLALDARVALALRAHLGGLPLVDRSG